MPDKPFDTRTQPHISVLGIRLYAGDIKSVTSIIIQACKAGIFSGQCISATGAHGLVQANQDPFFKKVLKNFYLNLPDGMPGVWIGRLKGAKQIRRCYGPSVFESVLRESKDEQISHFFCGGNPGVAMELKAAVYKKFCNPNVVGTYCPPFLPVEDYDYDAIAEKINQTKANIVWVGLSTPKQEIFAMHLSEKVEANFIITVGAAFDFHTNKIVQAPTVVQKIGLEWFFRMIIEPRRLFRRYLEIVPLFIFFNIKELLNFPFRKK